MASVPGVCGVLRDHLPVHWSGRSLLHGQVWLPGEGGKRHQQPGLHHISRGFTILGRVGGPHRNESLLVESRHLADARGTCHVGLSCPHAVAALLGHGSHGCRLLSARLCPVASRSLHCARTHAGDCIWHVS